MTDEPRGLPVTDHVNLVVDCDAGVDDLVGLAVAAMHARSRLLAVSIVGGNVPTSEGTQFAKMMLELSGHGEVPVLRGLEGGGVPPWDDSSGSDRSPETASFAALRDIILAADSPPILVATGSLTNVAVLLKAFPQIVDALSHVVFLGGVFDCPGNSSPVAERNVYSDPEAAREVIESGVEVILVPINVSGEFTVPPSVFDSLAKSGRLLHDYLATILYPYRSYYQAVFGTESCPLHDPLAVLLALAPHLFVMLRAEVSIELRGEFTRGATVVDLRPEAEVSNDESRIRVVRAVDQPGAWAEMAAALELSLVSPIE